MKTFSRTTLVPALLALLMLAFLPADAASSQEIEPPEGLVMEEGEVPRTQQLDGFLATLREAYENKNLMAIREMVHPEWGLRAWMHIGNVNFSVAASCTRSRSSLRRLAGELEFEESWWQAERCPPLFSDEMMQLGDPVRVKLGPPPHIAGDAGEMPFVIEHDIYLDRPDPVDTRLCGSECWRDGAYSFPYHFDYRLAVRTPAGEGDDSLMFLFVTTGGDGQVWLTHAVRHPFAMCEPYIEGGC